MPLDLESLSVDQLKDLIKQKVSARLMQIQVEEAQGTSTPIPQAAPSPFSTNINTEPQYPPSGGFIPFPQEGNLEDTGRFMIDQALGSSLLPRSGSGRVEGAFKRGVLNSLPVPQSTYQSSPQNQYLQPSNVTESLAQVAGQTAVDFPLFLATQGAVTAAAPVLKARPILSSVAAGLPFGAGKSLLQGQGAEDGIGGLTREALVGGTSTAALVGGLGAAGNVGEVFGRALVPGKIIKNMVGLAAKQSAVQTGGLTGRVVAAGGAAGLVSSAMGAPDHEILAQALQGGLFEYGFHKPPSKKVQFKDFTPEAPKQLTHDPALDTEAAMAQANEVFQAQQQEAAINKVLNYQRAREEEIYLDLKTSHEESLQKREVSIIGNLRRLKREAAIEGPNLYAPHEYFLQADIENYDVSSAHEFFLGLSKKSQLEGDARGAQAHLEKASQFPSEPALIKQNPQIKSKEIQEYAKKKAQEEIGQINEEVLRDQARQESISETIIQANQGTIFAQADPVEQQAEMIVQSNQDTISTTPLLSPEDKFNLEGSALDAKMPSAMELETSETVRIAQLLDNEQTGGINTRILFNDQLDAHTKSGLAKARDVDVIFRDLQKAGLDIEEFNGTYKFDEAELKRFQDFLLKETPKRPFSQSEFLRFSNAEKAFRQHFDAAYPRLKSVAEEYGIPVGRYVNDYYGWFAQAQSVFDILGNLQGEGNAVIQDKFAKAQQVPLPQAKRRGLERPDKLVDPATFIEMYFGYLNYFENFQPVIAKHRAAAKTVRDLSNLSQASDEQLSNIMMEQQAQGTLTEDLFAKRDAVNTKTTPENLNLIARYYDKQANETALMVEADAWSRLLKNTGWGKGMLTLSRGFVKNITSTMSIGISQMLGLVPVAAKFGMVPTSATYIGDFTNQFYGMMSRSLWNPEYLTFAETHSSVVRSRLFAQEASKKLPGVLSYQRHNRIGDAIQEFNNYMDRVVVSTAFNTATQYARKTLGMSSSESIQFGDVWAARTNAVFNRTLKPQILREVKASVFTPLVTSTIANANTFIRDGVMSPDASILDKMKFVGRWIGMTTLIAVVQDQFRSRPGNPIANAFAQQIPLFGDFIRAGGGGIGALKELSAGVKEVMDERKVTPRAFRSLAALGPVQGTIQAVRTYEGIKSWLEDGIVRDRNGAPIYRWEPADLQELMKALMHSPRGTKAAQDQYYNQRYG